MKISQKVINKEKLKRIEEENEEERKREIEEEKQRRDEAKLKKYTDIEREFEAAVQIDNMENDIREQISPKKCLEIVKDAIDQLSVLPRSKVIEALKTDEDLAKDIEDLKTQAKIIFKYISPENHIRKSVVSLFKISLGVDLELNYIKPLEKHVDFSGKIEEIDPEREAILEKLKKKNKK